MMNINARLVNKKRHTVGYQIGSKHVDLKTAISMARKGIISGVKVCGKGTNAYLAASAIGRPLLKLPAKVITCKKTLSCRSR